MEHGYGGPGAHHHQGTKWEPIGEAQFLCSYWLKRAETRVSASFARELKYYGLIPSEWAALREMYRPGRTSSLSLAQVIGMTKGGASKVIDRLVRKGFATRTVGELDRRCRPVGLTRRGKILVPHLAMLADSHDHDFFRKANLRYHLMRALKRVVVRAPKKERVDIWHVPRTKSSRTPPESAFYYPGAAPLPSADQS